MTKQSFGNIDYELKDPSVEMRVDLFDIYCVHSVQVQWIGKLFLTFSTVKDKWVVAIT